MAVEETGGETGRAGTRNLGELTARISICMNNGRVRNLKLCKLHEQVRKCSHYLKKGVWLLTGGKKSHPDQEICKQVGPVSHG